jgi:CO/xanthine dehydrogenase Mo-binding subunit
VTVSILGTRVIRTEDPRFLTTGGVYTDDMRREQAKRRADGDVVQLGIGLSSYVEITGPGMEEGGPRENATVEVHPDGSATILAS